MGPTTRRRLAAAALTALLPGAAAVACSSQGSGGGLRAPGSAAVDDATAAALTGRTFVSTAVTEDGAPRPLVPGTRISLDVTPDELRADAGCNHLFGDVAIDDDRLLVTTMGSTEMGCPDGRLEQDDWLVGVLESGPTWRLDGDVLVLTSGATVIELVDEEVAAPDAALVGTRWVLETMIAGQAASSVPTGVTATLAFDDIGKVVGSGTCNGFGGTFTATAGTLTFAPGPTTLIGCPGGQAVVENAVAATLSGVTTYSIAGDQLTITVDDGSRGLVYRASA